MSDKLKPLSFTQSVFENPGSTLCGFGFSFPAPLREALFLAKAQREDVRRKGLNRCLA
ncbi:MAG TPA: hypothetical protein VGC87_09920 [Pyrinomonadaceae bacterium]|jgi:hypothetical protein